MVGHAQQLGICTVVHVPEATCIPMQLENIEANF